MAYPNPNPNPNPASNPNPNPKLAAHLQRHAAGRSTQLQLTALANAHPAAQPTQREGQVYPVRLGLGWGSGRLLAQS